MMMMMMIFMTIHENPNQPQNNQLCNEKEHSKETQRKQHDQNVDMIRMIRLEVMEMEATWSEFPMVEFPEFPGDKNKFK